MWWKRRERGPSGCGEGLRELNGQVRGMREDFAASAARVDGVAREFGAVRDRVLEAVAEERDAAGTERRRSHEWREARGGDLAELKETGEALRGWLARQESASQGEAGSGPAGPGPAGETGEGDGARGVVTEDGGESEERQGEHVEQYGKQAEGSTPQHQHQDQDQHQHQEAVAGREPVSAEDWRRERGAAEELVLRKRRPAGRAAGDHGGEDRGGGEGAAGEERFGHVSEHGALLLRAATVSSAQLVCHRDAWEFVAARAGGQGHYRPPSVHDVEPGDPERADAGEDEGGEPLVRVTLSGRSLIAVLVALWEARHEKAVGMGADWALAVMAYERIRAQLVHAEPEGDGVEGIVRIRLDDRVRQPAPATAQSVR